MVADRLTKRERGRCLDIVHCFWETDCVWGRFPVPCCLSFGAAGLRVFQIYCVCSPVVFHFDPKYMNMRLDSRFCYNTLLVFHRGSNPI